MINLRAVGRLFARNRYLVPASHYDGFTGTNSLKTRWRFTRSGADCFCFAGTIRRGQANAEAFAFLTVDAGPDVATHRTRSPWCWTLGRVAGRLLATGRPAAALACRPAVSG